MTHGRYHIRPRGGTAAEWAADNPVLWVREIGVETDTLRGKIGDGVTPWNALSYAFDEAGQVAAEQARAEAAEAAIAGNLTTETNSRTAADAALQTDVDTRLQTIAYAEDVANTAIALGNGVLTALQLTFSVPPSASDVTLKWGGTLTVTAAGNGGITIAPCDVTAGAAPSAFQSISGTLGRAFLTGTFSSIPTFNGETNIGPSVAWRTFRLYGFVGRDGGSTLAASMRASGASPYSAKTWMRAVLG